MKREQKRKEREAKERKQEAKAAAYKRKTGKDQPSFHILQFHLLASLYGWSPETYKKAPVKLIEGLCLHIEEHKNKGYLSHRELEMSKAIYRIIVDSKAYD
jgi:hypothetical protein